MYKIGVIGDKDSVLGFKALGFNVFPVAEVNEAEEVMENIVADDYAIIYIIEDIAKDMGDTLEKYKARILPALIPIPGNRGSLGFGMGIVKKSVEKAVGADILFRD